MSSQKLKVFISWSGDAARMVAEALREWLPNVLHMVEPWLSSTDIEKGAKWRQVVSGELENTHFAVICLTTDNLNSPWLLFEAGALSKKTDSRICTYLFQVDYTDVRDPLSQFQHSKADEIDTRKLVESINRALAEDALDTTRLHRAFEKWWPELEGRLRGIAGIKQSGHQERPRPEKLLEMVAEILTLTREQTKKLSLAQGPAQKSNVEYWSAERESQFLELQRQLSDQGATVLKIGMSGDSGSFLYADLELGGRERTLSGKDLNEIISGTKVVQDFFKSSSE
jgi:5-formyltetrahydrofolate cyclo-ligase